MNFVKFGIGEYAVDCVWFVGAVRLCDVLCFRVVCGCRCRVRGVYGRRVFVRVVCVVYIFPFDVVYGVGWCVFPVYCVYFVCVVYFLWFVCFGVVRGVLFVYFVCFVCPEYDVCDCLVCFCIVRGVLLVYCVCFVCLVCGTVCDVLSGFVVCDVWYRCVCLCSWCDLLLVCVVYFV